MKAAIDVVLRSRHEAREVRFARSRPAVLFALALAYPRPIKIHATWAGTVCFNIEPTLDMSIRRTLTPSLVVQPEIQLSSLLPFLFQTRTLLSRRLRVESSLNRPSSRRFTCLHQKQTQNYKASRSNHVPFEDPIWDNPDVPFGDVQSQYQAQGTRRSTMTASEKAVFDRIFKDIQSQPSDKEPKEDDELDDELSDGDPNEDLNSIFDSAIQELRSREEKAMQADADNAHYAFRNSARAVDAIAGIEDMNARTFKRPLRMSMGNGIVLGEEIQTEGDQKRLVNALNDHKTQVSGLFKRASTDVEIWRILETEVFSLVKQLNTQIEDDQKAREADRKAREAEEKALKAAASGKVVKEKQVRAKKKKEPLQPEGSIALPANTLFHILQTNYATCLLSAMRLLRRHFPTSNYALYLLPTIKRLGPISYVLGASTGLYNELLFLKWTQYSDLHGMADLLQEMMNRGIDLDIVTMVLLKRVRRRRRYGKMGRLGPVVQKWWDLRGTGEGWSRIVGIEQAARREEVERAERASLASREETGRLVELG